MMTRTYITLFKLFPFSFVLYLNVAAKFCSIKNFKAIGSALSLAISYIWYFFGTAKLSKASL
jgi:hypothetical protein